MVKDKNPQLWITKKLKDVAPLQRGFDLPFSQMKDGVYPVVFSNGVGAYHSQFMASGPGVVTGRSGTIGRVHYIKNNFWPHNTSLWVTNFHGNNRKYIYYLFCSINWVLYNSGSGVPTLNRNDIHEIDVLLPPVLEQEAIATALSDIDALIDNMEKLIAKKKAIKHGAMQELLTGERRLPGFTGEWKEWTIEECSDFFDNQRIPVAAALRTKGNTPYYGANGILDYVEGYTHDGEYVLIAEDGANSLIDYPVLYSKGKIWVNNHAHVISGKRGIAFSDYIAYALKMVDFQGVLVGGTRAKLNSKTLKHIKLLLPELDEQRKIVIVLRDMDSEIEKLEKNLSKYKNIKSGMMSELLTGRIRLV